MSNRKTNVEVVVSLMEHSKYGPLAQMFVMDALGKYARHVADSPPEAFESMKGGFISPDAWQGVAREVAEKVEDHLSPKNTVSVADPTEVTQEEYLAMHNEIERITTDKSDLQPRHQRRIRELEEKMENSPWELDPDEGVVEKRTSGYRP